MRLPARLTSWAHTASMGSVKGRLCTLKDITGSWGPERERDQLGLGVYLNINDWFLFTVYIDASFN